MKSLKQWLQRLVTPGKTDANRVNPAVNPAGIDIEKTINDALTAAGLLPAKSEAEVAQAEKAEPVIQIQPDDADLPHTVALLSPAPEIVHEINPATEPARAPTARRRPPANGGSEALFQFTNDSGTRNYAVHLPWPAEEAPQPGLPIIVMLHGCTQSVADFATGTQMNMWADREGFIVVYPEQSAGANPSRCWNWFRKSDQRRGKGEPSIIAGIALEACAHYHADPTRIFVAGLSAGGAMAVIVGDAYPEIFAAVATHSGLRLGAAHDVPSAFTAMKSGVLGNATAQAARVTPTLVLQGDADKTVAPRNADAIIADVLASAAERAVPLDTESATVFLPGRKQAQRTVHSDNTGKVIAEYWRVQGGAHAWFGGDARGSYTDPAAPDASEAIVRFFGLKNDGVD